MSQDLQHLIDRIQAEAVARAEEQAQEILAKAQDQAAAIVKEAKQEAKNLLARAQQDAEQHTERSIRTLEQVARDLLISVGKGVQTILDTLVRDSMDQALDVEVIKSMLVKMAEAYMARGGKERRIAVLVAPEDEKTLVAFYAQRFREKLGDTIEILPDASIGKGFRVSFVEQHAHHEFTKEAIGEALSRFLRPHLSEIVQRVAEEGLQNHQPADEVEV